INLFRFYSAFIVLYLYGIGYIATHLGNKDYHEEAAGLIVSVLFIFITYVFSCLDKRNREILNNSREAICYLETKYKYDNLIPAAELKNIQIFNRDKQKKDGCPHIKTHSWCFNLIFIIGYGLSCVVIFVRMSRLGIFHFVCQWLLR
ncbi:TPA: hypothetical protein KKX06_002587, partial [Legionella pneumophila]|nr:hypothetical protein [Legionella pneumophila]